MGDSLLGCLGAAAGLSGSGVFPILSKDLPSVSALMAIWSAILTSCLGLAAAAAANVSWLTGGWRLQCLGAGSWSIEVGGSFKGLQTKKGKT